MHFRPRRRSPSGGSSPSTVLALSLSLIAAVYIGFAVADGRPKVIAVESTIAAVFVVLAGIAVTATAWILVLGFAAHGFKDAWQERSQYVANTRWWPPFCAARGAGGGKRRRRRLLDTTNTLDSAIDAPAMSGLSSPAAASGMAATL